MKMSNSVFCGKGKFSRPGKSSRRRLAAGPEWHRGTGGSDSPVAMPRVCVSSTSSSPEVTKPSSSSVTEEQKYACVAVAYLALRLGAGPGFDFYVCTGFGVFAAYVAHTVFDLDQVGAAETGAAVWFAVGLVVCVLGRTAADALLLAALFGVVSKPATTTFDGKALKQVLRATRKAAEPQKKNLFDKIKGKVAKTFDDAFASWADRAADVQFYDLIICLLAKVTPPTSDEPVYVVGAFARWYNVNAAAIYLDKWLADFAKAHSLNVDRRQRTMLFRMPQGVSPGAKLAVKTPRGGEVTFVVPDGAVPGSIIQIAY